MKGAGYHVPEKNRQELHNCLQGLWTGGSDANATRQCEEGAMGSKNEPGTVGASFAAKWGSKS